MSSTYRSAKGTVAARVQAIQHAPNIEDHSAKASRTPRAFSRPQESGVTVGHGRREDSSFGSPAARAPRDGADGVRGDGRPPVGPLPATQHPTIDLKEGYSQPATHPSSRPATSLATNVNHPNASSMCDENGRTRLERRRSNSVEHLAHAVSELSAVRSKLRPVTEKEPTPIRGTKPRAYTLIDLGNMIDDAIEEHAGDSSTTHSRKASGGTSTDSSSIQRSKSARATREFVDDRHEAGILTRSKSHHTPIRTEAMSIQKAEDASFPPRRTFPSLTKHTATPAQNASPVKQKAALFENMEHQLAEVPKQCEAPHERHIHVKTEWSVVPQHIPTKEIEANLHELKFGRSIRPRPDSPLIPLALPQLVGNRPQSRRTSMSSSRDTHESFNTARQSEDVANPTRIGKIDPVRKASKNWPFKWNLFNKGSSVLSLQTEHIVNAEEKDEHYPPARASIVKSRVQDLLAAAGRKDDTERIRRRSEVEQLSRRQSITSSRRVEGEAQDLMASQISIQPASPAALSSSSQGQNRHRKNKFEISTLAFEHRQSERDAQKPRTLLDYPPAEKEVLGSSSNDDPLEILRSVSPIKTVHNTPSRGRSNSIKPTMSPSRSQYAIEQRFSLSPRPSRSQSRSRMKVEVEVRDSPEREARERGDKIVIIRANVEATKEGEEDEHS